MHILQFIILIFCCLSLILNFINTFIIIRTKHLDCVFIVFVSFVSHASNHVNVKIFELIPSVCKLFPQRFNRLTIYIFFKIEALTGMCHFVSHNFQKCFDLLRGV